MHAPLTLRRLVRDMGEPLLRLVVDSAAADEPLTGVAIHDPVGADGLEAGCLLLGVGVAADTAQELLDLGRAARRAGVRGLAVRGPVPACAAECPVPVVEVNHGASWMHVAATVRQRLEDHAQAQWGPAGATSDLFTLANTISTMIQAAVTIEDAASAVLAWSVGPYGTDPSRVETILGRAVRPSRLRELTDQGVFEQLHSSTAPVYLEPYEAGMLPRVAIAVRADAEVLGYVWAVVDGPLPDEHKRWLELFAPVVALHLANTRSGTSAWARRQRQELASAVLAGGPAGVGAARELRLNTGPLCVIAFSPGQMGQDATGDAVAAANLRRLEDVLTAYLAAVHPSAATVRGDRAVYVLAAWPQLTGRDDLAAARALAADFLARSPAGAGVLAAVAGPAAQPGQVPAIRAQADAVLRAQRQARASAPSLATLDDMALPVLLQHLADIAESLSLPPATGPLRRLLAHDGADGTLTQTLTAYLATGCMSEEAATRLRVHANTLRYRLRRIREISGLDFQDADQMLLAQIQLKLRQQNTPLAADEKRAATNS
ncbi:PucR family transcriptional regulator [Streptomyces coeruleorubidus]|uniref:PucR family transcriptional regulator n=1 Tax=Streptomyces coeruleorubidus TaxID=116188 RepID=UPI0036A97A3F